MIRVTHRSLPYAVGMTGKKNGRIKETMQVPQRKEQDQLVSDVGNTDSAPQRQVVLSLLRCLCVPVRRAQETSVVRIKVGKTHLFLLLFL